ncbi:response regulator [Geminicoccus flavidas]|uniref:response regulator n=1 Tax=Geminicoccus flavidas TaxID=2506407 RepID=UPI00190F327C|nr:response regulator [Geminicoccus flavidas]
MPDEPPLVLVVEDDPFIALDEEALLRAHGWRVLGPAHTVADALALLDQQTPDLALLDVEVGTELVTPVAAALHDQGVPFVLCSSRPPSKVAPLAGAPLVGKPFRRRLLLQELERACPRARSR